jgi:hypothetical protein
MDRSKIVIAQFYTSNVSYGKYSEVINKKYCEEKGYTYFCEKEDLKINSELINRSATWYKPKLIQDVFNTFNPEYVLFMDIDAIISDFNKNIEDYIDENYNLLFTRDVSSHSVANAGVFIIKNNEWSTNFLKTWWESADIFAGKDARNLIISEENLENIGYYKYALWHDQTCFTILYEHNEDIRNNTIIIDNRYLNCPSYDTQAFIFHAYSYGLFKNRTIDTLYYSLFDINGEKNEVGDSLIEIVSKYRTDKHYEHDYFNLIYNSLFNPIFKEIKKFIEIGIGEGDSLNLWRDYFTNATIYGLDINTNISLKDNTRIELKQFDQSNINQLKQLYSEHPDNDVDIIIDDGSHKMSDQQITFAKLFKILKPGGIYIIEDLHTSLEAPMPEKFWCNWGDASKTLTLDMLNTFIETSKIESDYLTEEDKEYLNNNIESIKVYRSQPNWSITSIIVKK